MNLQHVKTAIKNKINSEKKHILSIQKTFKPGGNSGIHENQLSNTQNKLNNIKKKINNSITMNAVFNIHGIKKHIPNGSIKNMYNKYHGKTNNNKPKEQSEFQIFKEGLMKNIQNNITNETTTPNITMHGVKTTVNKKNRNINQGKVERLKKMKNQVKQSQNTYSAVFNINGIHTVIPRNKNNIIRKQYNEYRHKLYTDLKMDQIIKDYITVINKILTTTTYFRGAISDKKKVNTEDQVMKITVDLIVMIHDVIKIKSPHAITKLYNHHYRNFSDLSKKISKLLDHFYKCDPQNKNIRFNETCTYRDYIGARRNFNKFYFSRGTRRPEMVELLEKYPTT